MRTNILHIGAGELTYEIRNIVRIADQMRNMGLKVNLENIGDPVTKGEIIPEWMKSIIAKLMQENDSYGYCPTQGVLETRKYLAEKNNAVGGAQITPDNIIFFNGLGDAITKIYGFLRRTARIITPSPTYTTHSSSEAAHAGTSPVTYSLNPHNNWYPDTIELRKQVKYNPSVAGILIINPDNPTGVVYPESILREIVSIAKEFDLFIIADEIYLNLVYNGQKTLPLAAVIGDVPAISMKGISKELPWPGSRCGWIEVYNADKDPMFADYVKSILNAKMVEVCSTTLPQKTIPRIFEHPNYPEYLDTRRKRYEKFANIAYNRLKNIESLTVNRTNGALYMSAVFNDHALNQKQTLPISNDAVRKLVENLTENPNVSPDKRFVYYLLGATGICIVPLSSFSTQLQGFRMTLLEPNESEFVRIVDILAENIQRYLYSYRDLNEDKLISARNFSELSN